MVHLHRSAATIASSTEVGSTPLRRRLLPRGLPFCCTRSRLFHLGGRVLIVCAGLQDWLAAHDQGASWGADFACFRGVRAGKISAAGLFSVDGGTARWLVWHVEARGGILAARCQPGIVPFFVLNFNARD